MSRVLAIDDEPVMLHSYRRILERERLEVDTVSDAIEGRERALHGDYELVLLDVRMPELDGMEILAAIREHRADVEVIVVTGYSSIESAVHAVKLGAFDYLPKPFTPRDLVEKVREALEARASQRHVETSGEDGPLLIGTSEAILQVQELIARVAPTDATVLLLGETGTGKELAAQRVHASSARRNRPFVSIDCSALAPGLLESELFGHEKGSFTGAVASKPGLFEIADGGTLFLDEVSNIALETQGKLLRVLESGEIKPVGGVKTTHVDIRLVAAANRDLAELVERGQFRGDLFYRLNVVPIRLPPLRERTADIPRLVEHFLARYRRRDSTETVRLSAEALERLARYAWPGNVRELKNLVERLVVTTEAPVVRVKDLPSHIADGGSPTPVDVPRTNAELKALKKRLRDQVSQRLERSFVIEALRRNHWNVSQAARETGLLRPNLHALMRKHGIRAEE